jgi:sulfate permease, SulP family
MMQMRTLTGAFKIPGDFWGGLAAMLVALPAAVAFGVAIYSAISPQFAAFGALAGVLGAAVIGLIAPTFGGTDRLISAPCAPAAAVLSAFAIELLRQGTAPGIVVLLITVLGLLAGLIQILIGFVGLGQLIKYIPHPVVSGYLSAVGLIIIGSQLALFVGAPDSATWWDALLSPEAWDWRALAVGGATVAVALIAPRFTKAVPATILGILAGVATYFALAGRDPSLLQLTDNPLVLGELGATGNGYLEMVAQRWREISSLTLGQITSLLGSALTLAALLSIDTLKTCVVLDQMTHSRHEPNRELVGQGMANVASAVVGGIPGAGTMGATLVNVSSGAQTRVSGITEGVLALIAALLFSGFIAWVPVATLAGILIVIGLRMIDTEPLQFLESRATVFDFAVVLTVVAVALTVGLIAASAAGVGLAILLFVREQVGGSVIRRKAFVSQRSSTWYRPEAQMRLLEQKGDCAVIFELQGSLFFGTTNQLYVALEPELRLRDYVIIDLARVQSIDITAVHMLNRVRDTLAERGVPLLLSSVRERLPNGYNLREFLQETGLIPFEWSTSGIASDERSNVHVHPTLESAIAWVEDRLVGAEGFAQSEEESLLTVQEMEMFKGRKEDTLADLQTRMEERSYKAGETIFALGDPGNELYLIRRGEIRVMAPIGGSRRLHHIATFGRGDFFGGLAFLDGRPRSNNTVAQTDCELYVLSLEQFNKLAEEHKRVAFILLSAIARTLAQRLRHADSELTLLHE